MRVAARVLSTTSFCRPIRLDSIWAGGKAEYRHDIWSGSLVSQYWPLPCFFPSSCFLSSYLVQIDFWCTLSCLRLKDTHKHKDPVGWVYEFKITTSEWVFSKPVQNVVMVITNASETLAKHCTSLPYFFSSEFIQNLSQL